MKRINLSLSLSLILSGLILISCNLPFPVGKPQTTVRQDPRTMTFTPVQAKLPEIQEFTTANGIQVIFIENHELPLISARTELAGGRVYVDASKAGLVNLFTDVLREGGAGDRTGDQINDFLESQAASVEIWGSLMATGANLSCLKEDFPKILQVLGDIYTDPKFDQAKLDLKRNLRLDQVRRENDNPHVVISREFNKALYPNSILGVRADDASYNNVTRDDLVKFWKHYYHPNNVILAITGDITRSELEKDLNAVFGNWPKAEIDVPATPKVAHKNTDCALAKSLKTIMLSSKNNKISVVHVVIRRLPGAFYLY